MSISIKKRLRSNEEIKLLAEGRISQRRHCSIFPTEKYSVPSYGLDINGQDINRSWLIEQLKKSHPDFDSEQIRILSNKLVIYINPNELRSEIERIELEEMEEANRLQA